MTGIDSSPHPQRALGLVMLGVLCGTAWAAGFRGYMAELAGSASQVDWVGTFAAILLPGAVAGGLLGWAEALRRRGGARGWRWLALAPLAIAVAPMLMPGALVGLFTAGFGGGAIVVPALGIGGGYAISGRGPLWARIVTGTVSVALLAGIVLTTPLFASPALVLTQPRGAWVAVLAASFLVVLAVAASIPHRSVPRSDGE